MQYPSAHEIPLLVLEAGMLLVLARSLGEVARRVGQPEFVGELLAGVVVGPSVLGVLLPATQRWLFPAVAVRGGALGGLAELALASLLLVTGFETDLGPVVRRGRPALLIATGGIVLPFACGLGLASLLRHSVAGPHGAAVVFDLFVASALSVSALPAVSKILLDLRLIRGEIGGWALAAASLNDAAGWILLCLIAGVSAALPLSASSVVLPLAGILMLAALALRSGPRACGGGLRWLDRVTGGRQAATPVALVLVALCGAAVATAFGLQPFVGVFAAGVALGRVPRVRRARARIEAIALGVFAPLLFAVAGLSVDLTRLLAPGPLAALAGMLAVAWAAKGCGAYLGARLGSLPRAAALNVGVALNARGAAGVVVAAVGLSMGALRPETYALLVVTAVVTSVGTPPLLRRTLALLPAGPDARPTPGGGRPAPAGPRVGRRILLPTRGGENARVGAQIAACLASRRGAEVTVLNVTRMNAARIGPGTGLGARGNGGPALAAGLGGRTVIACDGRTAPRGRRGPAVVAAGAAVDPVAALAAETRCDAVASWGAGGGPAAASAGGAARAAAAWRTLAAAGPPATTILRELYKGYDLMVIGASEVGRTRELLFGSVVHAVMRLAPCPTLVVRAGRRRGGVPRRILVPTLGDLPGVQAAQLAVRIAAGCGAAVTALHVVEARNPSPDVRRQIRAGYAAVDAVAGMGSPAGIAVEGRVALARRAGAEILRLADTGGFDLILMGARPRQIVRRVRFGRTVAHVLEHPVCDLAVLNAPADRDRRGDGGAPGAARREPIAAGRID